MKDVSKEHDINVTVKSQYIAKTVMLLSPNTCIYTQCNTYNNNNSNNNTRIRIRIHTHVYTHTYIYTYTDIAHTRYLSYHMCDFRVEKINLKSSEGDKAVGVQ